MLDSHPYWAYALFGISAVSIVWGIYPLIRRNKQLVNTSITNENPNKLERYTEEWKHYDKYKEAIISMEGVDENKVRELLRVVEHERVYLDDGELQNITDLFIGAVNECLEFEVPVDNSLVNKIISISSRRMNKRYKR